MGIKDSTHRGMTWLGRIRLRAIVYVIGIPLATFGVISIGPAWLTLPLVGVAVAAVTMTLNKMGHRVSERTCWTCGGDISGEPPSEHGLVCPMCGSLHQNNPTLAGVDPVDHEDGAADDTIKSA